MEILLPEIIEHVIFKHSMSYAGAYFVCKEWTKMMIGCVTKHHGAEKCYEFFICAALRIALITDDWSAYAITTRRLQPASSYTAPFLPQGQIPGCKSWGDKALCQGTPDEDLRPKHLFGTNCSPGPIHELHTLLFMGIHVGVRIQTALTLDLDDTADIAIAEIHEQEDSLPLVSPEDMTSVPVPALPPEAIQALERLYDRSTPKIASTSHWALPETDFGQDESLSLRFIQDGEEVEDSNGDWTDYVDPTDGSEREDVRVIINRIRRTINDGGEDPGTSERHVKGIRPSASEIFKVWTRYREEFNSVRALDDGPWNSLEDPKDAFATDDIHEILKNCMSGPYLDDDEDDDRISDRIRQGWRDE